MTRYKKTNFQLDTPGYVSVLGVVMINLSRIAFLNVSVSLPFIHLPQFLHGSGLCYCLYTFNCVFTCTAPKGNPRESWILDLMLWILDSSLCWRNLDSIIQSLVGFRIPWAVFRIPKPTILNSTGKNFPDSGIRILLHGGNYINSRPPAILSLGSLFQECFLQDA